MDRYVTRVCRRYDSMARMFKIVLLAFLLHLPAWADGALPNQRISPQEVKKVLSTIRSYAIVFGEGDKEVHSFIDPKCSMSRRFMHFVMDNKKMMKRYTYHFYLLELERLESKMMIGYIYDNENKNELLRQIMINDAKPEDIEGYQPDEAAESVMAAIAKAAETIGVYKRPYIIYNGKAK